MRVSILTAGIALIGIGCEFGPIDPVTQVDRRIVIQGLEQTIRLSQDRSAWGDTIHIASVVLNRSGSPKTVSARTCGVDLQSDAVLQSYLVRCAAYSGHFTIAPGDLVVEQESRIVHANPGQYSIRIRHLLDPEVWLVVPLIVQDCSTAPPCGTPDTGVP